MAKNSENPPADDIWLVSACLLGSNCRYNAVPRPEPSVQHLPILQNATLIPICPEVAGGLPTPRPTAQIQGSSGEDVLDGRGRVLTDDQEDVTEAFLQGATLAVRAAKRFSATKACLKARSPSCGVHQTHTKAGLVPQRGVAAAALHRLGLTLYSEEDLARGFDLEPKKGQKDPSRGRKP